MPEQQRLESSLIRTENWKRWGPYLSERQWGTVREDYSFDGDSWNSVTHEQARSRAYRWGEDGLLGITDRQCRLCFAIALWNGRDPILKERLFGLTGPEGNHGEDVKELYFYLDSTPTHSYMRALYKYPQAEFPYEWLVEENRRRGKEQDEFELLDTGVFRNDRFFDVQAEYAKASPNHLLIQLTFTNRGPDPATLHVLPTLWFRNTWGWGCTHEGCEVRPRLTKVADDCVSANHTSLGRFNFTAEAETAAATKSLLFTNNESNDERLYGTANPEAYVKDAFHEYVVRNAEGVINPANQGTKFAFHVPLELPPGGSVVLQYRLYDTDEADACAGGPAFAEIMSQRNAEADDYHDRIATTEELTPEQNQVVRQSNAGLLWSKQFYHYAVREWLEGDPEHPTPAQSRHQGRNRDWLHLFNRDVISMPDKWEYPWYAAWDLAFHMIPFARLDPDFAKEQLILMLREWYMHPNGQIPAYEFSFSDVNPPVHAWACWRVYKLTGSRGNRDRKFLARVFHKLMLNFTWWVNRKDEFGENLFSGGFLGLDNIGVFDRSQPLPTGGRLRQADGTAWMAFYCGTMLSIAMELASEDSAYEDVASKFFEHFVGIADAINTAGGNGLWDEQDGFYYDQLQWSGSTVPLRTRSLVGLVPLFAVEILRGDVVDRLPGFKRRMEWFLKYRPDLAQVITEGSGRDVDGAAMGDRLLAIPSKRQLEHMLKYLLDETEFLSRYGIRSLSRFHADNPYVFKVGETEHRVAYVPGESDSGLFGGNSNWRGPIWMPMNYLIIEALQRYHHFYGSSFQVECPTGSGIFLNLKQVAEEISRRLVSIFLPDENGRRPCHGNEPRYSDDPHWQNLILFYEYFHGESGRGAGASHQTGWTALVSKLLLPHRDGEASRARDVATADFR